MEDVDLQRAIEESLRSATISSDITDDERNYIKSQHKILQEKEQQLCIKEAILNEKEARLCAKEADLNEKDIRLRAMEVRESSTTHSQDGTTDAISGLHSLVNAAGIISNVISGIVSQDTNPRR